jgi:hypothetical protein
MSRTWTSWIQKYTTDSIDLKTTGQTILYTVPAWVNGFIVTGAILRVTAATAWVVWATVTIWANGSFNDYVTSTVTGLVSNSQYASLNPLVATWTGSKVYVSWDVIKFNITWGATATTLTASVDLFGYSI